MVAPQPLHSIAKMAILSSADEFSILQTRRAIVWEIVSVWFQLDCIADKITKGKSVGHSVWHSIAILFLLDNFIDSDCASQSKCAFGCVSHEWFAVIVTDSSS